MGGGRMLTVREGWAGAVGMGDRGVGAGGGGQCSVHSALIGNYTPHGDH